MPVNKLLSRIRASIQDLTPAMESFRDENVQPGVEDCARLQQIANELMELIAAYKYTKQNNEISPSFNLHAHISETLPEPEVEAEPLKEEVISNPEPPPPPAPEVPKAETKEKVVDPPSPKNGNGNGRNAIKALFIGINDKFRFINELFAHNDAEYNIAIEQLSNLKAWPETELYLASLKNLYGWKDNHDAVKYFYNIVKRRFQ